MLETLEVVHAVAGLAVIAQEWTSRSKAWVLGALSAPICWRPHSLFCLPYGVFGLSTNGRLDGSLEGFQLKKPCRAFSVSAESRPSCNTVHELAPELAAVVDRRGGAIV